jgi:threonine synthase
VSLGEGDTPLVWTDFRGRPIAVKCEFLNPSGSFKDRGSAIIAAWLKWNGVTEAVEDSSGNAGASFAAYATRAGIKACIYSPITASGPKKKQIDAYGAELVLIPGSRADVSEAVKKVAGAGVVYASHAYLPFNLLGYATIAYEIIEQMGKVPGTVVLPAGQGGLLIGIARGFASLRLAELIDTTPKIVGVQAHACAPLWASFAGIDYSSITSDKNETVAEGVRVINPLRSNAVIDSVKSSRGFICTVGEDEILPACYSLAGKGFYVEPTSAIVWAALAKIKDELTDPIVLILTGSGLKYG